MDTPVKVAFHQSGDSIKISVGGELAKEAEVNEIITVLNAIGEDILSIAKKLSDLNLGG